ncbi:MAG TPA: PQQ-binding-like beta-propeller repeat protein, partial [Planctomycetaceae bacterium]
ILVFDATGLAGHNAPTGDTRWRFPWGDNSDERVNVCQPAIIHGSTGKGRQAVPANQLLISSGYGRGSALISVTRNSVDKWTVKEVWRANTLKSKFSSVVVHGGHAFGLDDGILTCISLADGTRRWKQGRYGHGQLIIVNDMLLVQAEFGRIVLVKADSEAFREVAGLDALSERTWNHPVVAGRHLLVRNDREAVCYLLPVLTPSSTQPLPEPHSIATPGKQGQDHSQ